MEQRAPARTAGGSALSGVGGHRMVEVMHVLRWVVAIVLGAVWALTTFVNWQLAWHKLVRGEESGSFIPFAGAVAGVAAVLVLPLGAGRLPLVLIPVVLDIGVWLWGMFLVAVVFSAFRSDDSDEQS